MKILNQFFISSSLLHKYLTQKTLNKRNNMFAYRNALALGPILLAQTVLGYPKGVVLNPTLTTRDNEFIFSAIGDSWGVSKPPQNLHID